MAKNNLKRIEDVNRLKENKAKQKRDIKVRRRRILKLLIPVFLGIVAIIILIVLGLNRFQFRFNLDEEGYVVPKEISFNTLNTNSHDSASLYGFNNGDSVYSLKDSKKDLYIGEDKISINSGFPAYTRNGSVLYFLDDQLSIISNDFEYVDSYEGLRLSDGVTYNVDGSRADLQDMILVQDSFGYQLAQDTSIISSNETRHIPMNTICNFSPDRIDCYEYEKGILSAYPIITSDQNDIKIGDNTYNYLEFLKSLGIYKDQTEILTPEKEVEEVKKTERTKRKSQNSGLVPPSDVFEKPGERRNAAPNTRPGRVPDPLPSSAFIEPVVNINEDEIEEWVYSIEIPIEVYDPNPKPTPNNPDIPYWGISPDGVLISAFEIELNPDGSPKQRADDEGELQYVTTSNTPAARIGIDSSRDEDFHVISLSTLKPNTYYLITYTYRYYNQYGNSIVNKTQVGAYKTLDYSSLNPIELSLDDRDVEKFEFGMQINDLYYSREGFNNGISLLPGDIRINADNSYNPKCAEYYITNIKVEYLIGNKQESDFLKSGVSTFTLSSSETMLMRKGFLMDYWNSPNSLSPGRTYTYRIVLLDKYNHEFTYTGDASGVHYAKTTMRHPSVSISVPGKTNKPGSTDINVKWANKDNCNIITPARFYLTREGNDTTIDNAILLSGYFIDSDGNQVGEVFTNVNSIPINCANDGDVTSFRITNLTTQSNYTAYVICGEYDDNSGIQKINERLKDTFSFKSGSLSSYGLIRYQGYTDKVTYNDAVIHPRFSYNSGSLFDELLLSYLSKIDVNIIKNGDTNSLQTIEMSKDDLASTILDTSGIDSTEKNHILPTDGTSYEVPVKILVDGKKVNSSIELKLHYSNNFPKYDGVDATNLWEFILATSNTSFDAYFDIHLGQYVTYDGGSTAVKLVELEKTTQYKVTLNIFGRIEGSDALFEEDVTSSSSLPLNFTTTKQEPVASWGDFYISNEFVDIYNLTVIDPDQTIRKDRSGSNQNARIAIKERETGASVANYYFDTYGDIPSPIRINGLTKDSEYILQIIANEYENVDSSTNYEMLLACVPYDDIYELPREYMFVAHGSVDGSINLDSLYRTYYKGPNIDDENTRYLGLIKNASVAEGSIVTDPNTVNEGDLVNQTIEDTGWIYNETTNSYLSSLTKVEPGKSYSLLTGSIKDTPSPLPDYLKQIDYIQTSGQQYVKTGYYHNTRTEVVMTYTPKSNGRNNCLFGSRTGLQAADAFDFGFEANSNNYYYVDHHYTRTNGIVGEDHPLNITNWANDHTLTISTSGIKINDGDLVPLFSNELVVEQFATIGDAALEDYLFNFNDANNTPGSSTGAEIKLKTFTIYEDGLEIMNLVPVLTLSDVPAYLVNTGVKVKTGVACLYDTIGGKIYVNSGTGDFGYPTNVSAVPTLTAEQSLNGKLKQVAYIESANSQNSIDTAYRHNNDTVVDAIFIPIFHEEGGVWNNLFGSRTATQAVDTWNFGFNKDTDWYFLNTATTNFDNILVISEHNDFVSARLTKTTFTVDGKSVNTGIQHIGDAVLNDYIFANHVPSGVLDRGWFKLKYFKISENDVVIREFVPVVVKEDTKVEDHLTTSKNGAVSQNALVSAGTAGLYDVVNNILYLDCNNRNFQYPGSNSETADEELPEYLKQLKYIRSTGAQYINTGLKSTYGYDAQLKFSVSSLGTTWGHIIGSQGDSASDRHNVDGNVGWHNSYLRMGTSFLKIGYQNQDRFNGGVNISVLYDVDMANYDFTYYSQAERRRAAYLNINGTEVWNGMDDVQINKSAPAYNLDGYITLFAGEYSNGNGFNFNSNFLYECTIHAAKGKQQSAGQDVRHFIPVITTGTVPEYNDLGTYSVSKKGRLIAGGAPTGTVGLYDTISHVLYINSGSSTFRYGEFDTEDEVRVEESGTYTLTLYRFGTISDGETTKTKLIELDHIRSNLAANGNVFHIDKEKYGLSDDEIYAQIKVEDFSDDFRISGIYLEEFDEERYDPDSNLLSISDASILENYTYDKDGNRVEKEGYAITVNYTNVLSDSIYYLRGTNLYHNDALDYSYYTRLDPAAQTLANLGDETKSANLIVVFYNSNKEFISTSYVGSQGALFKTPASASYARFALRGEQLTASVERDSPVPLTDSITVNNTQIGDKEIDGISYRFKTVEYIQSDGTHWIDTNYRPNRNTKWEVDYEFIGPTSGWNGIGAGCGATTSGSQWFIIYMNGDSNIRSALGVTDGYSYYVPGGTRRHRYELNAHTGEFLLDYESLIYQYTQAQLDACSFETGPQATLSFFARESYEKTYQNPHSAKLYGSTISEWDNGINDYVVLHDYIPVVRTRLDDDGNEIANTEIYGIYDIAEGVDDNERFLLSEVERSFDSGEIVSGGNVYTEGGETYNQIEYIESHGGQAIDLGFVSTAQTHGTIDYEPNLVYPGSANSLQAIVGAYWGDNSMLVDIEGNELYNSGNGGIHLSNKHPEVGVRYNIGFGADGKYFKVDYTKAGHDYSYGYDWRYERYGNITNSASINPVISQFDTLTAVAMKYFNDYQGIANQADKFGAKAHTWVYVEQDTNITTSLYIDDVGICYARYADGTFLGGGSAPYGNGTGKVQYPNWKSVTFNLKAGWNEIVVCYQEYTGGDQFQFSPQLSTFSQITKRSAERPDDATVPAYQYAHRTPIVRDTRANAFRNLFLGGLDNKALGINSRVADYPSKYYTYGKFYGAEFYIDDTHRLTLEPVLRQSDHEAGMWGTYEISNDGGITWVSDPDKNDKFFGRAPTQTQLSGGKIKIETEYYSILNYIESQGAQYLDTRVVPNCIPGIKTKVTFMPTVSTTASVIFGSAWSNNAYLIDYQSNKYYSQGTGIVTSPCLANIAHTFELTTSYTKIDGQKFNNTDTLANTGKNSIKLLGLSYNNHNATGRLYSCVISSSSSPTDETIIRDFIPVKRLSDGEVGLWDRVHEEFYPNQGSANLIGSAPIGSDDIDVGVEYHVSSNGQKFRRDEYSAYISFVPEYSGVYSFTSRNVVSGDPYLYLYEVNEDGDYIKLAADDDSAGQHNFKLDYELTAGKKYALKATTSNIILKGEFEYDLFVTDSTYNYNFDNLGLYLYDAANLDSFTATFTAHINQEVLDEDGDGSLDPGDLENGEIKVKLLRTATQISQAVNLDEYTDWVDNSTDPIYDLPNTYMNEITGYEEDIYIPIPQGEGDVGPADEMKETIVAGYGYKAELYIRRNDRDSDVLLDSVSFIATQPVYVIKDIPTLKAVAGDMAGYYICVADLPNTTTDGDNKIDFTISNDIFTGVVDFQGHDVTLSSSKPLFNKIGNEALIKNANIIYAGDNSDAATSIEYITKQSGEYDENFIKLDYIEADGDQFLVLTGVNQSQNTGYEFEFERTQKDTITQNIVGQDALCIRTATNATMSYLMVNGRTYRISNLDINRRNKYVLSNQSFSIDDGVNHTVSIVRESYSSTTPVTVFASNNAGSHKAYGKLYYLKVYNGATLQFDGVPAIAMNDVTTNTNVQGVNDQFVSAGTAGLYDRVTGRFYASSYSCKYSKLPYSDNDTNAKQWLDLMLPDPGDDSGILDNKAPDIPLTNYYAWANNTSGTATPNANNVQKILDANGNQLYIPAKFARLEYLQSNGGAMIDTGYIYSGGTIYTDWDFPDTSGNNQFVMGVAINDSAHGYYATNFKAANGVIQSFNIGAFVNFNALGQFGRRQGWLWNNGNNRYWLIHTSSNNRVDIASKSATQYWANKSITLFAEAGNATTRSRIYAFYIKNTSGELVRNMIPVVAVETIPETESANHKELPAGTLGMYDTVTKLFYTNASTKQGAELSGPVATAEFGETSDKVISDTACIAKDSYGTLSNIVMHFHPKYSSAYAMGVNSAGFVLNNYGTIDHFALQFDDGNVNVKNEVSGIALHNYGTIKNGYVCGKEYLDEKHNTNYYGFVHRYNSIVRVRAIKYKDSAGQILTRYVYETTGENKDAGYISYITSHNHNNANVENVYVVDNLQIQSTSSISGQYGTWNGGTNLLDDDIVSLDYIESTGTQYIDTGYIPNKNSEFEVEWEPTNLGGTQAISGSAWNENAMLLDIQNSSHYGAPAYFNHGMTYELRKLPQIGIKTTVRYGAYGDRDLQDNETAFTWRLEVYSGGQGWATYPNPSTFNGKTPSSVRYFTDKRLSNTINIADNYAAKATTWLYSTNERDQNIIVKTDDQGTLYFNDTQIKQFNTNVETTATIHFKQGWNKLEVCYREGTGGDGVLDLVDNTSRLRLDSLSFITRRSCTDPETTFRYSLQTDSLASATTSIKLFGLGANNHPAYGKMYRFKIYETDDAGNSTLIHDFVPAITSDNVDGTRTSTGNPVVRGTPGLYDKVSTYDKDGQRINKFYPNIGTGEFACDEIFDSSAIDTDYSALICGYNEGKVTNVFTTGDLLDIEYTSSDTGLVVNKTNIMRRIGPALGACVSSYDNSNINYVSLGTNPEYINNLADGIYMHSFNQSSEIASLYDYLWYQNILGEDGSIFNLRSAIASNYFPQLIFNDNLSTTKIPATPLPTPQLPIRVVGSETRYRGKEAYITQSGTKYNQVALVTLFMTNPTNINISDIEVVDSADTALKTEILSQGKDMDSYRVDLLITYDNKNETGGITPKAESQYKINRYYVGNSARYFSNTSDENYVDVEFYHEIGTTTAWKNNLAGLNRDTITENYRLTNNISFKNSTDYHDWVVYANFSGKLDGGAYDTESVMMKDYEGNELDREIIVDTDLINMYTISDIGNVDEYGHYVPGRAMGVLNPSNYSYQNANSVRGCLFASVDGKITNTIFSNFRTVYFNSTNSDNPALYNIPNSYNDVTSAVCGVIAKASLGTILDNCHVRNSEFNTRGYGGALIGYASNASIRNCSVRNSTITGRTIARNNTPAYIGGLVGYSYNVLFDNSYVADINVSADLATYIVGTGGITGVTESSKFNSCYAANGTISSIGDCTGGLIGKVGEFANISRNDYSYSTTIDSCFTTVTVQSSADFVGGIAGYMGIYSGTVNRTNANKIFNSYTASTVISTNYGSVNINRINSFAYENEDYYYNNYAFANQIMNYKNNDADLINTYQFGTSTQLNGATRLLDSQSLRDDTTWSGEISLDNDSYDFTQVANGYMPKLINTTYGGLVYDQPNIVLNNDDVATLKILSVENKQLDEVLVAKFALYNTGWDPQLFRSYAESSKRTGTTWYDLADWSKLNCVGAKTDVGMPGDTLEKYYPCEPYITSDGGLVFQARFNYGDSELGHYSDAYLVTLPVYMNEPTRVPRITGSVYALIALGEDNVAAKNIITAADWDEFFSYNGSHYNTPENIRLFPQDTAASASGIAGDYKFAAGTSHAYNASIQKVYIAYAKGYDETNAKVVFSGNINYDIDQEDLNVDQLSFISRVTDHFCGIEFLNFNVNYNNKTSVAPVGIISEISGEFKNNAFINCKVEKANSNFVGMVGRITSAAQVSDISLKNVTVDAMYKNIANGGYGGFVGGLIGDVSQKASIDNITGSEINVTSSGGKNINVGGIVGYSTYANISNINMATGSQVFGTDRIGIPGIQELEYVESSDGNGQSQAGPSIDTGIKVTQDTKLVYDFVPYKSSGTWTPVCGTRNGSNKFSLLIGNTTKFYASYGSSSDAYLTNGKVITYGDRYVATLDARSGINVVDKKTNESFGTIARTVDTSKDNIMLFGVSGPTNDDNKTSCQRLYGAQIYDGAILIKNFVPCVTTKNVALDVSRKGIVSHDVLVSKDTVGLYDTVEDVLYLTCNSLYNELYYDAPLMAGPKANFGYSHIDGLDGVGGIVGNLNNSTIEYINLANLNVTGTESNIAGMVGLSTNGTIKDVYSGKDLVISGGNSYIGGILGMVHETDNAFDLFGGEEVINSEFDGIYVSGVQYTGGLIGAIQVNNTPIDGLTYKNVFVQGLYNDIGGLFGDRNNIPIVLTIKNSTFDNINIANGNSSTAVTGQYWGGLIGDENNTRGMDITNCTFNDFNIRGDSRTGGLIGRLYDSTSVASLDANNCHFTNFLIRGGKYNNGSNNYGLIGGIIGLCNSSEVTLNNGSTIDNFEIIGSARTGGICGGYYLGNNSYGNKQYHFGAKDTIIDPDTYETLENPRLEMNNIKITGYDNFVGGVIGCQTNSTYSNQVTVQNINIDNLDITMVNTKGYVGALAGAATVIRNCTVGSPTNTQYDSTSKLIIRNTMIRGASNPTVKIHGNVLNYASFGAGALGTNKGSRFTSDNIKVYNASISSDIATTDSKDKKFFGGIAGQLATGNITNSILEYTTIDGYSCIGGIVGFAGDPSLGNNNGYFSDIKNCEFNDSVLSGYHLSDNSLGSTGGIIGGKRSGGLVFDTSINNSAIFGSHNVGGIIGNFDAEYGYGTNAPRVIKSGIYDSIVLGDKGSVGGVVGNVTSSSTIISNCFVSNGKDVSRITFDDDYNPGFSNSINQINNDTIRSTYNNLYNNFLGVIRPNNKFIYSSYVMSLPGLDGSFETNACGGIVGSFTGASINDCIVDDNTIVYSYRGATTYASTGGIIGYLKTKDDLNDYERIEYVQSNRSPYIDTGLTVNGTYVYDKETGNLMGHNDRVVTALPPANIMLFGVRDGNSYSSANQKIYSCQIYEGDLLIADYVPVRRKSDNTIGLYDTVAKVFHGTSASNTTFVTSDESKVDTTATLITPEDSKDLFNNLVLSNSIVNASIVSNGVQTSSSDVKEATGGFIGYYKFEGPNGEKIMHAMDYYDLHLVDETNYNFALPYGKDYNRTQGPDPFNFSNLLFTGHIKAINNADVGVGYYSTLSPTADSYDYLKDGGTYHDDFNNLYYENARDGDSYALSNYYGTQNTSEDFANYFINETVNHSARYIPMNYDATMPELIVPHIIDSYKENVKMRESGLGRLRILHNSDPAIPNYATISISGQGINNVAIKNEYSLTHEYSNTLTPDILTDHIECLTVPVLTNEFYFGSAEYGNMELDHSFWDKFISGALSMPRSPLMMSSYQPPANVEDLIKDMRVYPSGIDTINVEFASVPRGTFDYQIEGLYSSVSGTWPANTRIMTFKYDFSGDLSITLNGLTSVNKLVGFDTFSNTIMTYGNSCWYINNGQVINDEKHTDDEIEFIHMYDGKLLDKTGKIYDAVSGNVISSVSGISNATSIKTLWSGIINTDGASYTVNTFSNYSMSNGVNVDARIYVKNNTLITLSAPQPIIGGPIADTYNGNIYATVLLKDGTLLDLGTSLNYPVNFKNNSIKEITNTIDYDGRIALVRYTDNTLVGFNYITGEKISVEYNKPSLGQSLGSFFANSLKSLSLKRNSTSNAEGSLNNASVYSSNVNNDQSYANALKNVTEQLKSNDSTIDNGLDPVRADDIPSSSTQSSQNNDSELLNGLVPVDTIDDDILNEESGDVGTDDSEISPLNGVSDGISQDKEDDTEQISARDGIKEYKIENNYISLFNAEKNKSEIFEISEVLSVPSEKRISEEDKTLALEKLGFKTMVSAQESSSQNTLNGIYLILLIVLILFFLVFILFIIRKRNFVDK